VKVRFSPGTPRAVHPAQVYLPHLRSSLLACDSGVADRHTPRVTEQSQTEKEEEMSARVHLHPLMAVAMGLGLAWLLLQPAAAAPSPIGFAVVEPTPTPTNGYTRALSGVSLGGYGSSCPLFGLGRRIPAGIHDKLYARALALESGGTSFVLVMID